MPAITTDARPLTVELADARLRYRGLPVFDGLNLLLAGGQWTCLLGRSGVGKTSLLRLLAGLVDPQKGAGRITCDDGAALTGRLAYMAQQDLLLPWLNALQNVLLGYRLRQQRREKTNAAGVGSERRARELLHRVGLAGHEQDLPASLSGGMRQRVALARTLMEDRPVVLMDEPYSALDAITRYHLQNLAAELLARRTVLLVTHDPLEALRLGHRIHVLAGAPADLGDPLEPGGKPPRNINDPELLALQGELLARLAAEPNGP